MARQLALEALWAMWELEGPMKPSLTVEARTSVALGAPAQGRQEMWAMARQWALASRMEMAL